METFGDGIKQQRAALSAIVLLFWFSLYVYVPYQTNYLTSQGVSMDTVGVILGIYGGIQMCFRMPIGIYSDVRRKHGFLIALGMAFVGTASVLRVVLPAKTGFFLGNVLAGFGSAMWSAFMAMFLGMYPVTQKKEATSRVMFYNNVGKLAAFVCATLFYPLLGMKFLCLVCVAGGYAGMGLGIWLKGKRPPEAVKKAGFSLHFLNSRLILFSLLTLMQQGVQMSTAMSYTSKVLENIGASQMQIGLSSIIYMAASVYFSGIVSTEAVKKRGPQFWIPFSFVTVWLYCWIVPNITNVWGIWLCQIAAGLQTGLLFTYLIAEAVNDIDEEQRATALAFFQMTYAVGMTVFPMLSGMIAEHWGLKLAYGMLGIMGILGVIISSIYYARIRGKKE